MGKLPSCETRDLYHMEDILTSYVFGAFKYLHPSILFSRFIDEASFLDVTSDNAIEMKKKPFNIQFARVEVIFWPKTSVGEPDVVVVGETETGEDRYLMIFECKYLSGLGTTDEDNQLTRYSKLLNDSRLEFTRSLGTGRDPKPLGLFYITGDSSAPMYDLNRTWRLLRSQKREKEMSGIYWLSWKTLWKLLNTILDDNKEMSIETMSLLSDLCDVLVKRGLRKFTGFRSDFSARVEWPFKSDRPVPRARVYFQTLLALLRPQVPPLGDVAGPAWSGAAPPHRPAQGLVEGSRI